MIPTGLHAGVIALVALALLGAANNAAAHCDTLNGPVVSAARMALQQENVALVLRWVNETEEAEVREAFQRTMVVRGVTSEARELADMYFVETRQVPTHHEKEQS